MTRPSAGQPPRQLWARHLGPDTQTLNLRFAIAGALRSLGRFAEARDLDTHVLEQQQVVLESDHPHALTLMTAGGLAATDLRALGEYQQALVSDQKPMTVSRSNSARITREH